MKTSQAVEAADSGIPPTALILATLETKTAESEYLRARLAGHGVESSLLDLSLGSRGEAWDGERKTEEMDRAANRAIERLRNGSPPPPHVAIGLGGGTGGEIILRVFRSLPPSLPKILVTTLPFDPRPALADDWIVLVPSIVDICGLNDALRLVLERTAALAGGLCGAKPVAASDRVSVAVTSLGATAAAADALLPRLEDRGAEATLFHANGYGGAAFARAVAAGRHAAAVDLTPHELTRLLIDGDHIPMPSRFTAAGDAGIPQIVLPGCLNFLGLGPVETLPPAHLARPHYRHSGYFTHAKLTRDEMTLVATTLCRHLNAAPRGCCLIVPMGGFSHRDRPGGAICDPDLRETFYDTAARALDDRHELVRTDAHICDPDVAALIVDRLRPVLGLTKD